MAPADTAELMALPGAAPFSPSPGRIMTGWTLLPREVIDGDAAIDAWLVRAIAFAASLPPK